MKTKRPFALYVLFALLLFQGISGVSGGLALIIAPRYDLINIPASALKGSVFTSYLIPGLVLCAVLGAFPIFTFSILLKRPDWKFMRPLNMYNNRYVGWQFSLFTGFGLLIFLLVEISIIGYGAFIQTAYFTVAILILIFTLAPRVMRYYQTGAEDVVVKKECNCRRRGWESEV